MLSSICSVRSGPLLLLGGQTCALGAVLEVLLLPRLLLLLGRHGAFSLLLLHLRLDVLLEAHRLFAAVCIGHAQQLVVAEGRRRRLGAAFCRRNRLLCLLFFGCSRGGGGTLLGLGEHLTDAGLLRHHLHRFLALQLGDQTITVATGHRRQPFVHGQTGLGALHRAANARPADLLLHLLAVLHLRLVDGDAAEVVLAGALRHRLRLLRRLAVLGAQRKQVLPLMAGLGRPEPLFALLARLEGGDRRRIGALRGAAWSAVSRADRQQVGLLLVRQGEHFFVVHGGRLMVMVVVAVGCCRAIFATALEEPHHRVPRSFSASNLLLFITDEWKRGVEWE